MHTHNARSQYLYPHANQNAIASSSQSHVDGGGDYWTAPDPYTDPYSDYPWYED